MCRSMSVKAPSKVHTARFLRPLIRTSRTTSPWLSRNLATNNGTPHHLVSSGHPHLVAPCRRSRLYATPSLASDSSSAYSGFSSGDRTLQLVLSDAQRLTIYALSTPPGKAGVAVVRISGPGALDVWRGMVRTRAEGKGKVREHDPEPWKMHRCDVVHPRSGEVLDDGLAVFFKGVYSMALVCAMYSDE